MTTSSGTHSFTHDVLGRLTAADHPSGSGLTDEAYGYDSAFSRTSWTNASGEHDVSEVEYDEGDRLVQDLLFTYAYDAEGRRTSRTGRISQAVTSYGWDSLGQLVEVEEPDGDVWGFDYDALGRRTLVERVPTSGPTETWTFVYDDQGLVRGVYDDMGDVVAEYVTGFGFGEVLAELRPDGQSGTDAFYAVRDKLGSPVAWLDEAGAIAEEVARDAYGNRTAAVSAPVPYGYTGHAEDPTGLVWGRARYLDPGTGGWLSEDPVWGEPRTGYVGGGALEYTDRDGKSAWFETHRFSANAVCLAGITYGGAVLGLSIGNFFTDRTKLQTRSTGSQVGDIFANGFFLRGYWGAMLEAAVASTAVVAACPYNTFFLSDAPVPRL